MAAPEGSFLFRLYAGGEFRGAGVLVSRRHVLQCAHVVERDDCIVARRDDEPETEGRVIALSSEDELDLALLGLDTVCGDPPLWSHEVHDGTQVNLQGFPRGESGDRPPVRCAPR